MTSIKRKFSRAYQGIRAAMNRRAIIRWQKSIPVKGRRFWAAFPCRWSALLWHGPMFSHSLTGGRLTKVVRNVIHSEIESGECDK